MHISSQGLNSIGSYTSQFLSAWNRVKFCYILFSVPVRAGWCLQDFLFYEPSLEPGKIIQILNSEKCLASQTNQEPGKTPGFAAVGKQLCRAPWITAFTLASETARDPDVLYMSWKSRFILRALSQCSPEHLMRNESRIGGYFCCKESPKNKSPSTGVTLWNGFLDRLPSFCVQQKYWALHIKLKKRSKV